MPMSPEEHPLVQPLTFGEALRREREVRRVSLREISESTKINIRYLEALERNDFTYLPPSVYTRGYVRAFAQYIGTDDKAMLNGYLHELARQERQKKGPLGIRDSHLANVIHFSKAALDAREKRSNRRMYWIIATVVLVLILALAIPLLYNRAKLSPSPRPAPLSQNRG